MEDYLGHKKEWPIAICNMTGLKNTGLSGRSPRDSIYMES